MEVTPHSGFLGLKIVTQTVKILHSCLNEPGKMEQLSALSEFNYDWEHHHDEMRKGCESGAHLSL